MQAQETPITYAFLKNSNLSGINAWDVSSSLETLLVSWLSKGLKKRRKSLGGGVARQWIRILEAAVPRVLKGTGKIVDESGRRLLQDFPQCRDMMKLSEHLDDCVTLLDEYGKELTSYPLLLRTQILAIIPSDLETILTDGSHAEVKTYQDIIRFCKARTYRVQQKVLASNQLKSETGRMNAL